MKKLELMGVQEMDAKEMKDENGGGLALYIAVMGAAIYVYNNWGDFVDGMNEGYRETRKTR